MKVPMIVYAPGGAEAGKENTTRVRNLDLAPTFLDIAGVANLHSLRGKVPGLLSPERRIERHGASLIFYISITGNGLSNDAHFACYNKRRRQIYSIPWCMGLGNSTTWVSILKRR